MVRQIRLLAGIQLRNLFGINEVRFTKDKAKRYRALGLALVWIVLLVMFEAYIAATSYGYVMMELTEVLPAYLFTISSLLMFFFTFFKAGSIIFQMKSYEMTVSMPVSGAAIVISRFFTMYVTNFFMGLLFLAPGVAVYGIFEKPPFWFYLVCLAGTVILPMIPLAIATAISAGVMAVTAKMRHKSIASALLAILLVIGCMALSIGMSTGATTMSDEEMLLNMATVISEQLGSLYPPALWFQGAAIRGSIVELALLILFSIGLATLLLVVLQKNFFKVCSALNATSAKNNYRIQSLSTNSVTGALWKKEMKRYFASSVYVTNTMIGYILMAIAAVGLFFSGTEQMEEMLQMPGIVGTALPLLLGLTASIMPITACSVSMEGKNWWLSQTLPVRARDIWNGKILFNLSVAAPFYLIAVLFSILAVKPDLMGAVWIVVIPFLYIVFSSVTGIAINLMMPIFNWENEVRVVKQSASCLVTMLVGVVSALIPCGLVFVLKTVPSDAIYLVTAVVLLLLTVVIYGGIGKRRI